MQFLSYRINYLHRELSFYKPDPSKFHVTIKNMTMNWNLIFKLSLFGLAMGIATVYWIPFNIEPYFWLVIFIICAYAIAKNCSGKYFLHGFFLSLVNCIWITAAHVLLFKTYATNHPEVLTMNARMPLPTHPRIMTLILGPVFGVLFGLILGLFAFVAGKLVKRPATST